MSGPLPRTVEQQHVTRRRVNWAQTVGGRDKQNAGLNMLNNLIAEELQSSDLGSCDFSALFGFYQGCGSDLTQPGNDKYSHPAEAGVEQFTQVSITARHVKEDIG